MNSFENKEAYLNCMYQLLFRLLTVLICRAWLAFQYTFVPPVTTEPSVTLQCSWNTGHFLKARTFPLCFHPQGSQSCLAVSAFLYVIYMPVNLFHCIPNSIFLSFLNNNFAFLQHKITSGWRATASQSAAWVLQSQLAMYWEGSCCP